MRLALAVWLCLASPGLAELALPLPPGAVETGRTTEIGRYDLPIATYSVDTHPAKALQGEVLTRAWRFPAERGRTAPVMASLKIALEKLGFEPVFECHSDKCGGFDFRFALPVMLSPQMEVDLNDFRYLSAVSAENPDHYISLLVSRSERGGHVQLAEVMPPDVESVALEVPTGPRFVNGANIEQFRQTGRAVLDGVTFASGSTDLADGSVQSLAPLVALLEEEPDLVLLIVGHSDNEGGLDANIRLSRSRAGAVRNALIAEFGISPERLEVAGAGFMSPRALNDTEEGRALNRRVEIVKR